MKASMFAVSALALAAGAAMAKPPADVSIHAVTMDGGTVRGPGTQSFDFEAPAFAVGALNAQSGWVASSPTSWLVSGANPAGGAQHARGVRDTTVGNGVGRLAFGPDAGALPVGPSTVSFDFNISNTGGADYDAIGQAPSQAFLTWRINFSYLGPISVVDDLGTGPAFVDTGAVWTPGTYANMRIEANPGADTLEYYLDNVLIYSGVAGIFAGTTVEQFVLRHDNWHLADESGDFDNINIVPAPGALALLGLGGLAAARRRRN